MPTLSTSPVKIRLLARLLTALSFLLIIAGAAGILVGVLGPWATFTAFHNIDFSLPGFFFAWGGLCLAVALLVFLGARRWPVLCLIGALLTLLWVHDARREVPHRVKHQLLGWQLALFPINRLLDQFHIRDIEVAEWNVPDAALLGPGLDWTEYGGLILLLGGALGLPGDPAVAWVSTRTARARCRTCGARWLRARNALFCPDCGAATALGDRLCPACHAEIRPSDRHCITCGAALSPSKSL